MKMKLNRVVVTGYGLTSPIGNTPEEFWNSLKNGKIGIGEITKFDHSAFDVHNAAEINDFPFDKYFVKKDTNRFDDYSLYALYAAQEAVNNANLDVEALDKDRFGVIVASGIGGIREIEDQVLRLYGRPEGELPPRLLDLQPRLLRPDEPQRHRALHRLCWCTPRPHALRPQRRQPPQ